jgi:integrase
MSKAHLTKREIDHASPKNAEYVLWDGNVRGLGLKVLPSGKKVFLLFYRTHERRQRRAVLGPYGVLTLDQARRLAREWLGEVARGGDPSGMRLSKREGMTIRELGKRYLEEYARSHKKPSSVREDERLLNKLIYPRLGGLKVESIGRSDVHRLHHTLIETPFTANRCIALISKMLNLAEAWQLRADGSNPCRHLRRYAERARDRFLTKDELARLGAALADLETRNANAKSAVAAIKFLALTGCRLGEAISLRWDWVNLPEGTLDYPDSKTGAKRIPLGDYALKFVAEQPKVSDWVFAGRNPERSLTRNRMEDVWKIVRKKALLENARLHDLRHTVGTYSGRAGHNAFIVRDILGHKTLAMTGRYVSKDIDPVRRAASEIARQISDALHPKEPI